MINSEDTALVPTIKTAKAQSIFNLSRGFYHPILARNCLVSVPEREHITFLPQNDPMLPGFARPCPLVPKHGFVDSRAVYNLRDIMEVYRDTLKEDSDGELVVMKQYTGKYSGVATNAGVTFGYGNDSVTSGGKGTVTIEAPSDMAKIGRTIANTCYYGGIELKFDDIPYFELVEHEKDLICVQARNGPELPQNKNYVPRDVLVSDIIEVDLDLESPDLVEWGKQFQGYKNTQNRVLHLKNGNLSSHYAIHAIQRGIAVWTEDEVPCRVGEKLAAIKDCNKVHKWTEKDWNEFYKWVSYWDKTPLSVFYGLIGVEKHDVDCVGYNNKAARNMISTAVATLHACTFWDNRPLYMALRAFAAVAICKYVVAACIGENRHWYGCGPGNTIGDTPIFNWQEFTGDKNRGKNSPISARSNIYLRALDLPLAKLEKYAKILQADLSNEGWTVEEKAYGGDNWANCASKAHDLIHGLNNGYAWELVMENMNTCVNTVHNGGKILSKWVDDMHLDYISQAPALGFMNAFTGIIVTDWTKENINGSEK